MAGPGCSAACARSRRRDGSASAGRCSGPAPGRATNAGSGSLDAGRAAAAALAAGESLPGRPLGPRQVEVLAELGGGTGRGAARGRAGRPSRTDRRCRARPTRSRRGRGPRASAPTAGAATRRPARRPPAASDLLPAQAEAVDRIVAAIAARDPRPLLLDGVTGGGKTAIYVEAIAAVARSRAAGPRARARDRPGPAARRPAAGRPRRPRRARPFRARRGRARRRVAPHPRRRRRHRGRDAAGRRRAAGRCRGRSSSTRSTTPPTRATGRRGSRRATSRSGWPSWRVPRSCSGRRRPRSRASAARRSGDYDRIVLPSRPVGAAPTVEVVDLRAELAAGQRGLLSRALAARSPALDTAGGRAGDPRPQPARHRVGRALPRLRPRPGLPGLRAAARLPPGRHDAALPPLRPGHAARLALPVVRLAADPLPRRRHGAGRARGPRHVPGSARRAARPRRRRAPRRGGARHRCLRRRAGSTSSSGRAS